MSEWENIGVSDEWYTPKYIFDALNVVFDLDVAHPKNAITHVPANLFYYENSLEKEWNGFVWMNPPFGGRNKIIPWLDKFFLHNNGIALCPDRTSAPWFKNAVNKTSAVLFMSPKVKFERADGTIGKSPGCGTALLAAGARAEKVLLSAHKLGWVTKNAFS